MSELWRNLIVSVSVLALSGVSYLAFAEPPIFALVYLVIMSLLGLTFVGGVLWSFAVEAARIAARQAVSKYRDEHDKEMSYGLSWNVSDAIQARVEKLEMPFWVLPVFLVLGVYLTGLRSVPTLRDAYEKPAAAQHQTHTAQPERNVP